MEELKKLSNDEKAKLFDETLEHLTKNPLGWMNDRLALGVGYTEKDAVDWSKQLQVILSTES
jgi:hypothetical protein